MVKAIMMIILIKFTKENIPSKVVQEIEKKVVGQESVDESFLARRLRNIRRMSPDILEIVMLTLADPKIGLRKVVQKVANRMKDSPPDNVDTG